MAERKHGVVVVHGQGDKQTHGAQLASIVNPVVDLLRRAHLDRNAITWTFDAYARPPVATIEVTRPPHADGTPGDHHSFHFREAFWDDAFPPPSAEDVSRWALNGLGDQLDGLVSGWAKSPTTSTRQHLVLGIFYRAQLAVLTGLLTAVSLLMFLVLKPLARFVNALAHTPGLRLFGATQAIADAIGALDPFLSRTLGDAKRFQANGA